MNSKNRYVFLKSRCGETVPAIITAQGETQPLHSMVDPKREAERLVCAITEDIGFIVFFGMGGGFAPAAALERTNAHVIVIDFDKDSVNELFSGIDYSRLVKNSRFNLLVDLSDEDIKKFILENYKPALHGGIKTIPLRTRVEHDKKKFEFAAITLQETIEIISGDYSVQACFAERWFSNIVRNIKNAEERGLNFQEEIKSNYVSQTAIAAAGPSLDTQIPSLKEFKSRGGCILSTDTALGALLQNGITPDAVVSIDCQHISYYHFMGNDSGNIPLIMDIASPPLLAKFSNKPFFFSSGHPLALYISRYWRPFPLLDTSGGNVTYACLSLAEYLGAKRITLFGADFSYVGSRSYARGTYIFPYFHKRQNRLSPLEAQFSAFLYRSHFLPSENNGKKNYYETTSLRFYRKKLEEKAAAMDAQIICEPGLGATISIEKIPQKSAGTQNNNYKCENIKMSGSEFLEQYLKDIAALPPAEGNDNYLDRLNEKQRQVFTTLLPLAAAVKKRNTSLKQNDLIEEIKRLSALRAAF